jgi:hypothetical protein
MRPAAMVLDYCADALSTSEKEELGKYLERWTDELWNHNKGSGWGLHDPGNNYHMNFLEGTAFAAYALKHAGRPSGDKWVGFLRDKLERPDGVKQQVDKAGAGGDWPEGANYGQLAKQKLFGVLAVIAGEGGPNYFNLSSFYRDAIYFAIYQLQPGNRYLYPAGDLARDPAMPVSPYDRDYVQAASFWLSDPTARGYAQWYLEHVVPDYRGPTFNWRAGYFRDVVWGLRLPAVNVAKLPLFYHAQNTHWVTVRSSWKDDATCVSISGSPAMVQSHQHQDSSSFTIWKRGWLAVDANTVGANGLLNHSSAHNMVTVANSERPDGPVGGLTQLHDEATFTYVQIDASGIFKRRQPGGGPIKSLVREYTREIVYLKPNQLVVYDRVEPNPGESYQWNLHFPVRPSVTAGRYTAESGGAGIALVKLLGGSATIVSDRDIGSGAYRVEVAGPPDGRFLHAIEVALGRAPAPNPQRLVGDGVTGVLIQDQVVVLSTAPRGAPRPLPWHYTVPGTRPFTHILLHLGPSKIDVAVSRGAADTTVTVSSGTRYSPGATHLVRLRGI